MIEIRVEMFSLWNVHSVGGLEVIPGHDVVDVVDSSWSESDLEEISGPDTTVGVLGLILGEVRCVHVIVDVSVSFIPLLIIILLEVLVGRVDGKVFADPTGKLELFVYLVEEQVVLLGDHAVTVAAVSGEDLEAYVNY